MLTRAALILIVIAFMVILAANWFVGSQTEEEAVPVVADRTTLRSTTGGDVVGFRDRYGARSWQGIAFAQPPVDDLRWRAPQSVTESNEEFAALRPGNVCPQFASLLSGAGEDVEPGTVTGDEDCLYLNIWSPPNASNLPVMVWVHGGGNSIGHGGSYSGAWLAANRDVVVVTINYRLGVFGWFNHPALHTNDPLDDSGNYGTLDVVAALEWVRDNIREFGGDAGNVTLFGESAGAADTLAMMASPLAEGLFHRAIVQSGGFRMASLTEGQQFADKGGHPFSSNEMLVKLLVADGTVANHSEAKSYAADMSQARIKEYLYNKPAEAFFAALDGGGFGMIDFPAMFSDGHVLPQKSEQEIFGNAENHNMVPIILGTNRDEPAIFMVRSPEYVDTWLGFIPRLKDEETYKRVVKYGALSWKERGVDRLAQHMSAAGNPDVYAYRFDWDEEPSQAGFDLSVALGAAHGLEIAFAFGEFEGGLGVSYIYPGDEPQYALANSMTSYWTQFAYTGDPGAGREGAQTEWLAWGQDGKRSIILDSPADQGIFMDDELVTVADIKDELLADNGFPNIEDKCKTYARTFGFSGFDLEEFKQIDPVCAAMDPASLPRF